MTNQDRKPRKTTTKDSIRAFFLMWMTYPDCTNKELENLTGISDSMIGKYKAYANSNWGVLYKGERPSVGDKGGITQIAADVLDELCKIHKPIRSTKEISKETNDPFEQLSIDNVANQSENARITGIKSESFHMTDTDVKLMIDHFGEIAANEGRSFKFEFKSIGFELGGRN